MKITEEMVATAAIEAEAAQKKVDDLQVKEGKQYNEAVYHARYAALFLELLREIPLALDRIRPHYKGGHIRAVVVSVSSPWRSTAFEDATIVTRDVPAWSIEGTRSRHLTIDGEILDFQDITNQRGKVLLKRPHKPLSSHGIPKDRVNAWGWYILAHPSKSFVDTNDLRQTLDAVKRLGSEATPPQ